jgi:hypothetical protein
VNQEHDWRLFWAMIAFNAVLWVLIFYGISYFIGA